MVDFNALVTDLIRDPSVANVARYYAGVLSFVGPEQRGSASGRVFPAAFFAITDEGERRYFTGMFRSPDHPGLLALHLTGVGNALAQRIGGVPISEVFVSVSDRLVPGGEPMAYADAFAILHLRPDEPDRRSVVPYELSLDLDTPEPYRFRLHRVALFEELGDAPYGSAFFTGFRASGPLPESAFVDLVAGEVMSLEDQASDTESQG